MASEEPHDGDPDDLIRHLVDLQAVVDAGIYEEVLVPGEPSRYELTEVGRQLLELIEFRADLQRLLDEGLIEEVAVTGEQLRYAPVEFSERQPAHEFALQGPEPCSACGEAAGYDGGGRCLNCRVGWSQAM